MTRLLCRRALDEISDRRHREICGEPVRALAAGLGLDGSRSAPDLAARAAAATFATGT
ncbi:MAG: hypothetical protein KC486_28795 [Myxococcales bacterium]|nr:hypothetical protein [Myxococcales bacterium]